LLSIYVVLAGIYYLRKKGGSKQERADNTLYAFEKTNQLVDSGIYRYIRHPLYSSLLYLTWGIFLKHITLSLCIIALLSSVFLYITARLDEKECIRYFGNQYADYMKKSKMFIPFVF
jgi:protein-S-isoprenylcysteine O-methyltransferase Ste14